VIISWRLVKVMRTTICSYFSVTSLLNSWKWYLICSVQSITLSGNKVFSPTFLVKWWQFMCMMFLCLHHFIYMNLMRLLMQFHSENFVHHCFSSRDASFSHFWWLCLKASPKNATVSSSDPGHSLRRNSHSAFLHAVWKLIFLWWCVVNHKVLLFVRN
jgi:hypothetical protein